ncbi:MAG: YceD family protein [Pseudomonadota bacterium]
MPAKSQKPEDQRHAPPRLDGVVNTVRLARNEPHSFDVAAKPEDCSAAARFLGIRSLDGLRLKGKLVPLADDVWRAEGRLTAVAVQDCVVTLEPVEQKIDEQVRRLYLPEDGDDEGGLPTGEIDLDMEQDDDPDTYATEIDLGALALEAVALALDSYPRADGAALTSSQAAPPGAEPLTDDALKPFAKLEALRAKMAGGET